MDVELPAVAKVALPPAPARFFASDNASGVHPYVMEALQNANAGHALAYGQDPWTQRVAVKFEELFERSVDLAFTFGGTGANLLGLQCLLQPWQAVICSDSAHIAVDECGAPERFIGSKLIDLPTPDGKLVADQIVEQLRGIGDQHHVQPRVVSITQSSELGTLYSSDEIACLADTCHAAGLLLHVDGARIANAVAASAGCSAAVMLAETGVDVLTFGGTKNGMMFGEAVIFFQPELAEHARFIRKQSAQLPSKMRYIAAQFSALFEDDLWLRNAKHANAMAELLAQQVAEISGVSVLRPPQVNAVFASLPRDAIDPLIEWSPFYIWDRAANLVRWVCSYDTTEEDVGRFSAGIAQILSGY
jgi:threonine aldolase